MKQRIRSIDVLKIICTTLIVLHHYQQIFTGVPSGPIQYFTGYFYLGYLVELFFFLSGFLMFHQRKKIENGLSFSHFFFRRYFRLIPVAAVATLVYVFLSAVLYVHSSRLFGEPALMLGGDKPTAWGVLVTLLGLQSWVPNGPSINNPLWYVSVLLACCVLFYAITWAAARLCVSPLPFYAGMTLLGIWAQNGWGKIPLLSSSMGRGYFSFFPGVLYAAFAERWPVGRKGCLLCAGGLLCFAAAFFSPYTRALLSDNYYLLLPVLIYPMLLTLFLQDSVKSAFDRPWIETFGTISYDVFVWHLTGIELLFLLQLHPAAAGFIQSRAGMYAYVPAIWLFGAASHFWLEKPVNRRLREWEARFGSGVDAEKAKETE